MSTLDVEEQLRRVQERQLHNGQGFTPTAATTRAIRFVQWEYFDPVATVAYGISAVVAVTALIILLSSCVPKTLARRYAEGLKKARAPVLSSAFTPLTLSLSLAVWLPLISANVVLWMMKMEAQRQHMATVSNEPAAPPTSLLAWLTTVPFLCFAAEYLGVVGLWLYVLVAGGSYDWGLLAGLALFFPSFYQSMVIDSADPERTAVWVTHTVFLASLATLAAVTTPWIKREYKAALREINGHTARSLYHDRPEFRELRERMQQKPPSVPLDKKKKK